MAGSIEDIFLSCPEPKRNVVEPQLGFRWNSNDDPLSSLLVLVVCTRCATQDYYYAQVWRLDLHERCECMLDSVVQMYVGHQMLSTAGMELYNRHKFRILA